MTASLLIELGTAAGALLAVFTLLAFVARAKPVRWVWRRLVAEPVTTWHRAQTLHVIEPMAAELRAQFVPNGGASLRDRVDRLEEGQVRIESRLERWETVRPS